MLLPFAAQTVTIAIVEALLKHKGINVNLKDINNGQMIRLVAQYGHKPL